MSIFCRVGIALPGRTTIVVKTIVAVVVLAVVPSTVFSQKERAKPAAGDEYGEGSNNH